MHDSICMSACRDSDDWTDDRDPAEGEEGRETGFPRAPATFSGTSAEAAAVLAARADAIADKADGIRAAGSGRRAAIPPLMTAPASAAHPASPAEFPTARGLREPQAAQPSVQAGPPPGEELDYLEAVQPSVQPEPQPVKPAGMKEAVAVAPSALPVEQVAAAGSPEPLAPMTPPAGEHLARFCTNIGVTPDLAALLHGKVPSLQSSLFEGMTPVPDRACQSGVVICYLVNAGPGAAAGASKGPAVQACPASRHPGGLREQQEAEGAAGGGTQHCGQRQGAG